MKKFQWRPREPGESEGLKFSEIAAMRRGSVSEDRIAAADATLRATKRAKPAPSPEPLEAKTTTIEVADDVKIVIDEPDDDEERDPDDDDDDDDREGEDEDEDEAAATAPAPRSGRTSPRSEVDEAIRALGLEGKAASAFAAQYRADLAAVRPGAVATGETVIAMSEAKPAQRKAATATKADPMMPTFDVGGWREEWPK